MRSVIGTVFALLLCGCHLFGAAIEPIPLDMKYDHAKARLGKALFFDPRLSSDGSVACANCHLLPGSGADMSPLSSGVGGAKGSFNSPTVLNAVFNFSQFWDGRAADLAAQIPGPISNPVEMNISMRQAVETVKGDAEYVKMFEKLYRDGVTEATLIDAIVEFERALTTPNARFDRFLRGEEGVLTPKEMEGYRLFERRGCISCHNGVNMGGNMYQKSGVFVSMRDADHEYSTYEQHDTHSGRFGVTKREKDFYYFKVPSLRNVALTAPYFHDGQIAELETAVQLMMQLQLGITPDEKEVEALVAFLKTLTGEPPKILKDTAE